MQITINYTTLFETVKRSLSIIGKRSVDDQGGLLFDNITLGSREESIVYDYFRAAIVHIAAELDKYISLESHTDTSYTIGITLYDDYNDHLDETIKEAINGYLVAYALYSWFTVTAPRIHDKYLAEAKDAMAYLVKQCHHRQRPDTLPNPLRPKTDPLDT